MNYEYALHENTTLSTLRCWKALSCVRSPYIQKQRCIKRRASNSTDYSIHPPAFTYRARHSLSFHHCCVTSTPLPSLIDNAQYPILPGRTTAPMISIPNLKVWKISITASVVHLSACSPVLLSVLAIASRYPFPCK